MSSERQIYPQINYYSTEVAALGPVMIYYIPSERDYPNRGAIKSRPNKQEKPLKFEIQLNCSYHHRFMATITNFTIVLVRSKIPIVIPPHVEVIVKGRNCKVFHSSDCKLKLKCQLKSKTESYEPDQLREEMLSLYAADTRRFGEKIQVIIGEESSVWIPLDGRAIILNPSTRLFIIDDWN